MVLLESPLQDGQKRYSRTLLLSSPLALHLLFIYFNLFIIFFFLFLLLLHIFDTARLFVSSVYISLKIYIILKLLLLLFILFFIFAILPSWSVRLVCLSDLSAFSEGQSSPIFETESRGFVTSTASFFYVICIFYTASFISLPTTCGVSEDRPVFLFYIKFFLYFSSLSLLLFFPTTYIWQKFFFL